MEPETVPLLEEDAWENHPYTGVPPSSPEGRLIMRESGQMDVVYATVGSVDIGKKILAACRRRMTAELKVEKEVRKFRTLTKDLEGMKEWFKEWGVTIVAMESTGVYWKPIWNILEDHFELVLVNAHHLKTVPGRKTDVKDCEWIAQLLQHGLLKKSFVAPREIRDLRDLTRLRTKLVDEKTAAVNRIQKVLEDANIKLASVASNVVGVSCRNILSAMISGEEDTAKLADMSQGKLRDKIDDLAESLEGKVREHHRFMLKMLLNQVSFLEQQIEKLDREIREKTSPFEPEVVLLDTIDGVDRRTAETMIAEIGVDMDQYPDGDHLASWAGMCPGNNESAGKRKSGKTTKGSKWLRRALAQAAWATTRTKDSYLAAQYRRLAGRRGKKRAIVAVGHTILVAAYEMLKHRVEYINLGADYFDRRNKAQVTKSLVKRLEGLGYEVRIKPIDRAA